MKGSLMEIRAAIRRNDIAALKAEIAAGAPVNYAERERDYETVLMWAAEQPFTSIEAFKALVEGGADPALGAGELICRAARTGKLERVKYLESVGCSLLGTSRYGYTILQSAFNYYSSEPHELLEYLINAGVGPEPESDSYGSLISSCLVYRYFNTPAFLINCGGSKWDSAMFLAILNWDLEGIRSQAATVNERFPNPNGWFPLEIAVRMGDLEIVETLVSMGAHEVKGPVGRDLFKLAVSGGHIATINWAFENVRKGIVKKVEHQKLHETAVVNGSASVSRWLIDHGIRPPSKDWNWHYNLTQCKSVEMLDILLDRKKIERNYLFEPLFMAAYNGQLDIVKRLLERGATLETRSSGNVLHHAVNGDCDEVIDYLIAAGAAPNEEDSDWDTPLSKAHSLSVALKLIAAGADPEHPHPYRCNVKGALLKKDVAFERLFGPNNQESAPSKPNVGKASLMELRAAILRNDLAAVKAEIKLGVDMNGLVESADEYGEPEPILSFAAAKATVPIETLETLVEAGANPTEELIGCAAETGDLARVRFFEGLGCPVNFVDEYGYTILHRAILSSRKEPFELVNYALERCLGQSTSRSENVVEYCLSRDFFELARQLLDKGAMDSNPKWLPIFSATIRRDLEQIRANKADIRSEFFSYGIWSPVRVAISMGDIEVAQELKSLGALEKDTAVFPFDILRTAVETDSIPMVEWAFANAGEELIKGLDHSFIHYLAASVNALKVARWLIEHDIKPEANAFHACESPEMVDFYLEQGLDLNFEDCHGSAITQAVKRGSAEVVKHLISRGATVERETYDGRPIHLAVAADSENIVDYLIQAGAKLDVLDRYGDPPLCLCKSLAVAQKLIVGGADPEQPHWVYGTVRNYLLQKDVAFSRIL